MRKGSKDAACVLCTLLVISESLLWVMCVQVAETLQQVIWTDQVIAMVQYENIETEEKE
ncbi:MAG: hypothetical protein QM657_04450 [Lacrimispora sp.]|uniref:hypothetical protein n=1 Tax=Lacrimispora sp. TaxID=2719234 RepID=UPI0039E295BC